MAAASLPRTYPSVVHMLRDAAARAPQQRALVLGGESIDYQHYLHAVGGLAHHLQSLGLRGERVLLVMGNSIDIAIAMFAVQAAGAQVVPVNPLYTERELRQIMQDAEPGMVIHDAAAATRVQPLLRELSIEHALEVGEADASRLVHWAEAARQLPEPLPEGDMLATLQYTGGTTGVPKGVQITHAQLAINIAQREALLPTQPEAERILCAMPMFHVYAVAMALHLAVYARSTLVILPRYRPDAVLQTLVDEQITLFPGSPSIYVGLMQHEAFVTADFSHLRLCYSGSERLPEETLRAWEAATGCTTLEGFGQSEAGPVLSFNPELGVRKPLSVGVALPLTEIEIVDIEQGDRQLPAGEPGEIRARGPQIMRGYRNRDDETAQTLRDGWLYTGDLGYLDVDGYLFVVGRKKEMVVVSGYNVYPREIEELLCACDGVQEAAVVGMPDARRGEQVCAFVGVRPGATLNSERLRDYCAANLVHYKVPSVIEVRDALPRTSVGKIDKKALANG